MNEHSENGAQAGQDRCALDALLAEFQSLRSEIEWLIANGMRYQQFAIVIASAGLSASVITLSQYPHLQPALGFSLSAVLSWLGILYYWEHVEVHVVARYLQQVVREKVRSMSGMHTWWEWDEYKTTQWRRNKVGTPNLVRSRLLSLSFIAALFAGTAVVAICLQRNVLLDDLLVGVTTALLGIACVSLLSRLVFLSLARSDLSVILRDVSQPGDESANEQRGPRTTV